MESEVYEFIGTLNGNTYQCVNTVKDIYYDFTSKGIICEVGDVWTWLVDYNKLNLSTKELELYETYVDEACKDRFHSVDEDKLANEIFKKLEDATFSLSDEEMIEIISSRMDSCEWHEIDENGHNIKYLEEWEDILNDSEQFFNMHNPYRASIKTKLSFIDSQEQLYDLKIDLKGLDEEQLDDICRFIADEL